MSRLNLNDKTFILPDNWNQLTPDQFVRIAALSQHKLSPNEFKLHILLAILDLKVAAQKVLIVNHDRCYKLVGKNKEIFLVSIVDIAFTVTNCLGWIFKEVVRFEQKHLEIDCRVTTTMIPSIMVNGEKWFAPGDSLNNCIYEEYIRCLVSGNEFSEGHKSGLDKLIATLYRPASQKQIDGDVREPFNDHKIQSRSELLNKVPDFIKLAILLQFNGFMYNLTELFPNAFRGKGSMVRLSSKEVFFHQLDLVDNLAKHSIPEKELIQKAPLYQVLHTLDNLVKSQPKIKK